MAGFRVAVVDEHEVVRAGLQSWFDAHTWIDCAGSFPTRGDCLDWLLAGGRVDAVITEIQDGARAPDLPMLALMCRQEPTVIVHTRLDSDAVVLAGIDAGARTYLLKSEGRSHLLGALEAARSGIDYTGPTMAAALRRRDRVGRVLLSEREREVLAAWLRTDSKDDAGRVLRIAPATVRTHLQRIRIKYAQAGQPAPTKSALAARAVDDGLIGLDDLHTGKQC